MEVAFHTNSFFQRSAEFHFATPISNEPPIEVVARGLPRMVNSNESGNESVECVRFCLKNISSISLENRNYDNNRVRWGTHDRSATNILQPPGWFPSTQVGISIRTGPRKTQSEIRTLSARNRVTRTSRLREKEVLVPFKMHSGWGSERSSAGNLDRDKKMFIGTTFACFSTVS